MAAKADDITSPPEQGDSAQHKEKTIVSFVLEENPETSESKLKKRNRTSS